MKFLFSCVGLIIGCLTSFSTLSGQHQEDLGVDSLASLVRANLWDNPKLAQSYAVQYNDLAQNQEDFLIKAKGSNFIGMTHHVLGDVEQAIEYYIAAHDWAKQSNDRRYAAILLNNIGAAYKAREKPEETIKYYKEALATFEAINDTLWIANVNNNLAVMLYTQEKNKESEKHFLKARERYVQLGDTASLQILLINLAELYFDESKYHESEENISQFFKSDPPENDLYVYGKHLLAKMAIEQNDLKTAEGYITQTLRITKEKGFIEPRMNALKLNYTLLKEQGKYKSALIAHEAYVTTKDSLFNKQKDEQITEMLGKYESVEKEAEISRLSFEDKLNHARISQQRYALLAAIFGLGLLSFLLFRLFGQKRKIERQNGIISKALSEKDTLMREIHHRVKNNLQVISSLLRIQSNETTDEVAIEALKEGQSRVQSMSLIHQDLYRHDNLTGIRMKDYLDRLTRNLFETYNISEDQIKLTTDIEDIQLDVDTVVPLGLIINELVSNALKYAFPNMQNGHIEVSLKEVNNKLILKVGDDGVGMPEESKEESFGYGLIQAFVNKLEAEMAVDGSNGTTIEMIISEYRKT